MAQMFAYIVHKGGAIDDTAAELAVAAKQVDAGANVTAIVTGTGGELDAVCQAATAFYPEVWKFDHADLAYPNAEMIRKLLVNVLPAGRYHTGAQRHLRHGSGTGVCPSPPGFDLCGRYRRHRGRRWQHFETGPPGICRHGPHPT